MAKNTRHLKMTTARAFPLSLWTKIQKQKSSKKQVEKQKKNQQFNTLPLAFLSLQGLSANSSATSRTVYVSVGKVVNPLGTVTTITESPHDSIEAANEFSEAYTSGAYIHENSDEAMFRPYVAVITGTIDGGKEQLSDEQVQRPTPIGQKLIVPVIDGTESIRQNELARQEEFDRKQDENVTKFEQMSLLNRKDKGKKGGKMRDGAAKEIKAKQASVQKKVEDMPVEIVFDEAPRPMSRKYKEPSPIKEPSPPRVKEPSPAKELAPLVEQIPEVVTVKVGKKYNKISARFSEERDPLPKEEIKPISVPEEVKPLAQKKKKNRSDDCSQKENITLITDDVLNDDDLQPIIESAKLALSDILKADAENVDKKAKAISKPAVEIITEKFSSEEDSSVRGTTIDIRSEMSEIASAAENNRKSSWGEPNEIVEARKEETLKSKKANRKQKKMGKLAAEAAKTSPASTSPPVSKSDATEFTFTLKKNSISSPTPEANNDAVEVIDDEADDIAILENFEKTVTGDFTHIQDSLMNPVITATITVRKPSLKDRTDSLDDKVETIVLTKKEKKKKGSKQELEAELVAISNKIDPTYSDPEFSFAEPIETLEPDSLSFKSTTDDPISLINFESPLQESIDALKLACDDPESNQDGQFSDCKSFDLVADEPYAPLKQSDTVSSFDLVSDDAYTNLKQSDTNSSDETEDSSQGKNVKPAKIHVDDEELQPLISSNTKMQNDTTLEIYKQMTDALPEETNQSDSTKHQQSNKKKFRKKRR